jgi:hypothetical protein
VRTHAPSRTATAYPFAAHEALCGDRFGCVFPALLWPLPDSMEMAEEQGAHVVLAFECVQEARLYAETLKEEEFESDATVQAVRALALDSQRSRLLSARVLASRAWRTAGERRAAAVARRAALRLCDDVSRFSGSVSLCSLWPCSSTSRRSSSHRARRTSASASSSRETWRRTQRRRR